MIIVGRRVLGLVAGICLAASAPAAAQTNTGRISGTVADSSGGVLPGVSVTATNEGTGLTRTSTTDGQGGYVFVDLPVGTYTVKTELSGFKGSVKTGYTLNADGRVTVDFKLEVGSVSESVQVTAAGETVNTTSGEVARVVDREQVQNLALNGRNYMQLATLIPGSPVLDTNALDIMTGLGINTSVNGSRTNASL
ncbi:MAG TPA: carboxypeptidase-like regulatory domain-containing protein, partial [Vicinamibacterales bacterium]|nr:carboxypeptidase-like regulatory domain-containing protein [Vicinamibacterales bacterium]